MKKSHSIRDKITFRQKKISITKKKSL